MKVSVMNDDVVEKLNISVFFVLQIKAIKSWSRPRSLGNLLEDRTFLVANLPLVPLSDHFLNDKL